MANQSTAAVCIAGKSLSEPCLRANAQGLLDLMRNENLTRMCVTLNLMATAESNSITKRSQSEPTQRGGGENREATRPAGESPVSGQVEQSVPAVPEVEATESRYRTGLVRMLSRVTSDPLEVYHAMENLRAMIEETVRREIGTLRREVNAGFKGIEAKFEAIEAKIESLESQFKMYRSLIVAVITLLVALITMVAALIVLVVNLVASADRSGTPLPSPPSATVQAPARTETVSPTGAVPGSEAPALAAPGGTAVTADQPADQSTPGRTAGGGD